MNREMLNNNKKSEVVDECAFSLGGCLTGVLLFVLASLVFLLVHLGGVVEGEESTVNKLCQKQQYDFCQVDTYKLKDSFK